ncbi:MAG TPA: GntR family transcriptional regulator [Lactobacillaceae bacterium]
MAQKLALFEQLSQRIYDDILHGVYQVGDKMPSVRQLAVAEKLNPNTVAKTYQHLEQMGVIETIVGRGTFVAENWRQVQTDEVQALWEALDAAIDRLTASQVPNQSIQAHVLQKLQGELR